MLNSAIDMQRQYRKGWTSQMGLRMGDYKVQLKKNKKKEKEKKEKQSKFQFTENGVFKQQMLKMHTTAKIFAANLGQHVSDLLFHTG